ncbi:MAG: prepilin-type N-terminal cleavage/methylation domain-containing protein, partial [Lachnoclostridium sp.]|nr:prepilin-type N-terminal cleavage/methylation domain-containing protein [Lachnoclostridium sp.]
MKKEMNNKGFSLVELIIVIAIMVILVAVLAPQYLRYVEK